MKIDLHVHSKYSFRPSQWILQKLGCPESFTEPSTLYRIARDKGMDLVTITDHNTIAGSAEIAHLPDTFISEEVTTYFPDDGCKAHVLVYQINESIHRELQKIRENIFDLVSYLRQEKIYHSLAHPLYSINDKLKIEHIEKFILLFQNFELNGARDDYQNHCIRKIVDRLSPDVVERLVEKHKIAPPFSAPWRKHLTGGSDDHSSLNIARHYTEVNAAQTLEQYFEGIEADKAVVVGKGSTPQVLSHNLYGIAYQYYKRKLNLESKVGKDPVLRFLDGCLQANPEAESEDRLVRRLIYSWRERKVPRQEKEGSIQDLLRFEAQKLIYDNPKLREIARRGDHKIENRAQSWFNFVNHVSNRVLVHFWNSLLNNFSGANFLNIFQSLGSAGALYSVLAPYFVTFTVFSRDKLFSKEALTHFMADRSNPSSIEKPFKLVHFTDTFYEINGVALTIRRQLQLAKDSRKDLTVITCDSENHPTTEGVRNFEPIGAYGFPEYPEQKMFLPPFLEMLDYCYEKDFTQIHVATPGPLGLAALAIARIMKLPVSGTYHTAIPQYAQILTGDGSIEELVWKYTIWFYEQLDWVLVPSKHTGHELIEKGLDPGKIRLFPRGVDTEKFHPAKRDPSFLRRNFGTGDGLKILYVGRISKEKNLHLLVRAFEGIAERIPEAELVLVGDGPYLEDLKALAAGIPCVFTGYLEGEELASVYASCDLFAFPSATDTFGNVVLEAQASGLPVIVTNLGGPQENMIPQTTGFVVESGSVESLAEALQALLSDHIRLKEMGRAARLYMEKRSYELAFEKTWLIYRDCANGMEQEMAAAV